MDDKQQLVEQIAQSLPGWVGETYHNFHTPQAEIDRLDSEAWKANQKCLETANQAVEIMIANGWVKPEREYKYAEVYDDEVYTYGDSEGKPFPTYQGAYDARVEETDVVVSRNKAGDWEVIETS